MWARVRTLAKGAFRRQRMEADMAEELESHLAARTADLVSRGLSPADAARQARLEFGAVEHYREECREARGLRWLYEFLGDIHYTFRQYRQNPLFAILSVLVLAIGIGANTALFTAIDAVLLRMLPVQHPEQLRHLEWSSRKPRFFTSYSGSNTRTPEGMETGWSVSYPVYEYLRDHNTSFSGLLTFGGYERLNLTVDGSAELATGQKVSGNYFTTLGSRPLFGRTLLPEDDRKSAQASAAVLSYGYWERRFAADPNILGRKLVINGTPAVVVGVMPKDWFGVNPSWCPDVLQPMSQQPLVDGNSDVLTKPERWWFEVIARLKDGVTEQQPRAETELLVRQAIEAYHPKNAYDPPRIALPLAGKGLDRLRNDLQSPLTILAWILACVLVIVCANIGGLQLARAATRQKEIVTRLALGAGRARLVRQLLTETLVLSTIGGAAGLLVAWLCGNWLTTMFVTDDRMLGVPLGLNARVLVFSAALSVGTGLVLGLAPAFNAARVDLMAALKSANPMGHRSRTRAGKTLIAIQVGLAVVLTAGSALFVRTLVNLKSEPLGFSPENLLTFQLDPTLNGYRGDRVWNFHQNALKRIEAIPGIRAASMSRWGILSGSATSDGIKLPDGKNIPVHIHYVAPRFFETLGFALLVGRDLSWADNEIAKPVIVVNQAMARQVFPGRNPVGEVIDFNDRPTTIVGLSTDTKFEKLRRAYPATVYVPFRQNRQFSMTYVLRSQADPKSLLSAVRDAVRSVDPNVPLFEIKTQLEQIDLNIKPERLFASLLSGFAALSLLLACLGIYSTLAYQVTRRTSEIGVRMALGARRPAVVALVMRESAIPVIFGVAVGIATALAAGRMVKSFLYGLEPGDPVTLIAVGAALLASALIAAWVPARRAARIAPMEALRYE